MQAAIGVAQLKKLPEFVAKRQRNWDYLRENLDSLKDVLILPEKGEGAKPCWFGFIISVRENSPKTRDEIVAYLEKNNVQTRSLFAGNITRHPCFEGLEEGKDYKIIGDLKNTDFTMNNAFWVGVYPGMTQKMLDKMIDTIKGSLR